MKKALEVAAVAASLLFGSISAAIALEDGHPNDTILENAQIAEESLLGSRDDDVRHLAVQPFTRAIAARGSVGLSFEAALAEAGVPATVVLEARQAFAAAIEIDGDMGARDRFYVRYEQAFTAEGEPIGVARLLWGELRTRAKGPLTVHRFRPPGGAERLWLANGEAATAPPIRMPLATITVSSGYGLRADPLDKPGRALAMGPLPDRVPAPAPAVASAPAIAPAPVVAPAHVEPAPPVRRSLRGGSSAFGGAREVFETGRTAPAPALPVDQARPVEVTPEATPRVEQAKAVAPPARAPRLFMHDGVDLAAPTGTPVYAAGDGVVAGARPNGGYGNWIQIDHPGKLSTVYGHLSDFAPGIEAGTPVTQGELIGFVGNTGRSTGAHLHFEVQSNGQTVNPLAHPEGKRVQLAGGHLDRLRQQLKRSLEERERETKVESETAMAR